MKFSEEKPTPYCAKRGSAKRSKAPILASRLRTAETKGAI